MSVNIGSTGPLFRRLKPNHTPKFEAEFLIFKRLKHIRT